MKKLLEKRAKSIGVVVALFVIINVALSFAYIRGGSVGSESVSTVALTGGSVNVKYSSNSGSIVASDIVPGYETTKKFTITSEYGNNHQYYDLGLWYQINLVVDRNDFGDGSLTYSLSLDTASDDDGVPATNVEYAPIPSGQNLQGISVGAGRLINDNKSHVYNLKITYAETLTDQSEEIGSKFEAHITLTNPKIVKIIFDLDGGEISIPGYNPASKSVTASINSLYTLPIPEKTGYSFASWEIIGGNGTIIDGNILSVNEENITVKANYIIQSFQENSWEEIANNVKNGKIDGYNVGDTKEIEITDFTNGEVGSKGLYTVRITNISTPSECNTTGFSQSACGFVVEFEDIIEKRVMNSTNTNNGGWPATNLRTYLNGDFILKLPSELQSVIIPTTVVSSHGSNNSSNFTSTDKIYLLSTKEIWDNAGKYDSAAGLTRQMDYYVENGVTTSTYNAAIKQYNGTGEDWWTRTSQNGNTAAIRKVLSDGSESSESSNVTLGVAPAFRIG